MVTEVKHRKILENVCTAVTVLDKEKTLLWVNRALEQRINPYVVIQDGLCNGMQIVGKKCESGEIFFPQLIEFATGMDAALGILKSAIPSNLHIPDATIVMGVIKGDIHDIGKNILKSALASYGFRIIDLGKDVSPKFFIDAAIEEKADMICMSTSLSTTRASMMDVLTYLENYGLKDRIRVIIGGNPMNEKFAEDIGADGYASNAATAVHLVRSLLGKKTA